jgi:hypothetical protein
MDTPKHVNLAKKKHFLCLLEQRNGKATSVKCKVAPVLNLAPCHKNVFGIAGRKTHALFTSTLLKKQVRLWSPYVVGSKSFRPDIQKPRQMENAVRDV